MRDQSSRPSGNARRATLATALVIAGLGLGVAGCGDDEEDEVTKSVNEAIESIQQQASTALDDASEQAQSVQSQADEALEQAQEELDQQQQNGGGGGY
jgi:uncharacterized protein HemX